MNKQIESLDIKLLRVLLIIANAVAIPVIMLSIWDELDRTYIGVEDAAIMAALLTAAVLNFYYLLFSTTPKGPLLIQAWVTMKKAELQKRTNELSEK